MPNKGRTPTEVDAACGAIMEELQRHYVLDDTVIIFTTDNGNFRTESQHGLADNCLVFDPLFLSSCVTMSKSICVPLIIQHPRMKEENQGTTNDEFTLNIDLAWTILAAVGAHTTKDDWTRHVSVSRLNGETLLRASDDLQEIVRAQVSKSAIFSSQLRFFCQNYSSCLLLCFVICVSPARRCSYGRIIYMFWLDYPYKQLFDLVNDPEEVDQIFNSTDPAIEEIRAVMKKWFEELKNLARSDEIVTL
ncbi:hypothetical protein ACHAXA_000538 [Cyclostephanos tholiformis]|uniref:Sulfatase N-terminal domain-containing protein n=1 Tax=Cyclostephanos tholiformis TaxID=382380 RepID=A0ABD3STI1_9STRA